MRFMTNFDLMTPARSAVDEVCLLLLAMPAHKRCLDPKDGMRSPPSDQEGASDWFGRSRKSAPRITPPFWKPAGSAGWMPPLFNPFILLERVFYGSIRTNGRFKPF